MKMDRRNSAPANSSTTSHSPATIVLALRWHSRITTFTMPQESRIPIQSRRRQRQRRHSDPSPTTIRPCLPTALDVVVDDEIDMASSPEPVQVLDEIVADSADSSDSNNQGSPSRLPSVVKQRHHDSQQQHMKLDNTYAADILDSRLRSQNSGDHAYATIESDRVPSTPEEDVQCTKRLRMASVDVVQERA